MRSHAVKAAREVLDRQHRVGVLRLAGVTDQARLAKEVGVSQATISRDFKVLDAEFRQAAAQDIAAAKGLDLARIERLLFAVWPQATAGKKDFVFAALKLLERRARLLGLDAPTNVNLGGAVEVTQMFMDAERSLAEKLAKLPVIDITPQILALSTGSGDNGNEPHG